MAAKYRVLVTDYAWPSLEPEEGVLGPIDAELIVSPGGQESPESLLIDMAKDVDAIMTNWAKVTRNVIQASPRCKIVARYGVGVDNIDVATATERGIVVTNVPAYCVDEVSDHALTLLMVQARRVVVYDRAIRDGKWDVKVGDPVRRIRGKKLGIIGLGRIGSCLAGKARALGLEILAYDPYLGDAKIKERGAIPVDFPTLLKESDFISIHAPLSKEVGTAGLFGADEFKAMKSSAYIVNTARGGIIDDKALYVALRSGDIAGAGLDVLPTEPVQSDNPLLTLDNVILTPHASFWSEESVTDLQVQTAEEVKRALTGKAPVSPINPQVLKNGQNGKNGCHC
jgi:D-3-phosphoglycerate dehydrogenase / 2-oxoglutarate reductase